MSNAKATQDVEGDRTWKIQLVPENHLTNFKTVTNSTLYVSDAMIELLSALRLLRQKVDEADPNDRLFTSERGHPLIQL